MLRPKPRVLVIAGSDSSGGAGLEADQRVLALHNVYALTATTALTAQNTSGVSEIHPVPPSFVEACIEAVWDDFELESESDLEGQSEDAAIRIDQQQGKVQRQKQTQRKRSIDVVKIGMLHSAATIHTVARILTAKRTAGYTFDIVLDPVMKATSGAVLLAPSPSPNADLSGIDEADAGTLDPISILRNELLPLANIVTPNIPEALLLVSISEASDKKHGTSQDQSQSRSPPQTRDDVIQLARDVAALCARGSWVLVKGGHFAEQAEQTGSIANEVVDILLRRHKLNPNENLVEQEQEQGEGEEDVHILTHQHLSSRNTHGTGCSLASAIAANLALGYDMPTAVRRACGYVQAGIAGAAEWDVGRRGGGIDHWARIEPESNPRR